MIAVFSVVSEGSYAAEKTESVDDRITLIHEIGLMNGDDSGDLQLDKFLTRAESVTIMYRIKHGDSIPEASKQVFDDVHQNDWSAGYVEKMYEQGIIEGDGTSFHPNDTVKASEWYIMLLRLAGYSKYIDSKGEYPENVMLTAAETELSKGINAAADTVLTREQASLILYNMLDIEVIDIEIRKGDLSYTRGGSFMNDIMDIYTEKGIIDGICGMRLDGGGISDNDISIGGNVYYNSIDLGMNMLGMYGEYYYHEDDDGTLSLVGFFPKRNNVIELGSEKIISYENGTYKCDIDGRDKNIYTTKSKDVVINGTPVMNDEKMCPFYGNVRMVDNDNDNHYDVIIINDYKNVLCTAVNTTFNVIYCDESSGRTEIDLKTFSDYKVFDSENNEIELGDISKNTLLMLQYRVDNTLYITACDKVIADKIVQISHDEYGRAVLQSEDETYIVAPSNNGFIDDIKIGMNMTAYLDMFGNIGATKGDETVSDRKYGFIIKPVIYDDEESMAIKFLDQNGKIELIECSQKLKIDGQTASRDDLMSKIKYGDVVIYTKNSDGHITKVDTPINKSSYIRSWDGEDEHSIDNTWMCRAKGDLQYKTAQGALRRYTAMDLEGQTFVEPSTIIFVVPDSDSYTEESDYEVRAGNTINNDSQKKYAVYNDAPDSLMAQVLILYDSVNTLSSDSRLMLVDKVVPAVDNNGDESYIIKGLYGGVDTEYILKSELDPSAAGRLIQHGDVLRVTITGNKITSYEVLYATDGVGILNNIMFVGQSSSWDANPRYAVGAVEFAKSGKFIFKMDSNDANPEFYDASTFSVYVYDDSGSKKEQISVGTADDIRDMETYPDSYDTVIVGTAMSNGRELVLIRK